MPRRKPGPRARLIFWTAFGLLAVGSIYLIPGLSFYFLFQRSVLAIEEREGDSSLLATRAEADPGSAPEVPGEPWKLVTFGEWQVQLPPGERLSTRREDGTLIVEYRLGRITVDRFPPGFVRETFLAAAERTGGARDAIASRYAGLDDGGLLHELARVTTDDFRIGMDNLERAAYAASLVAKMYLWDFGAIDQFRLLERDGQRGVYIRSDQGDASLLVCLPCGVFMYRLEEFPVGEHRPDHPSWFAAAERLAPDR